VRVVTPNHICCLPHLQKTKVDAGIQSVIDRRSTANSDDESDLSESVLGSSFDSSITLQGPFDISCHKKDVILKGGSSVRAICHPSHAPKGPPPSTEAGDQHLLTVSLQTLVGSSELLGHSLENRDSIAQAQDPSLASRILAASTCSLRDPSQRPMFIIAPLDVLVTREADGSNRFHIIEINGE
jgi:hypothetical protein